MLVQPMVARMLLPYLGGAPSVWNTCMVFFQAGLLAGYAYAHLGPRWLGVKRHAALHAILLTAAVALLPIHLSEPSDPPVRPALWMLKTLMLGVAAPYALLASSSSLVQAWFAACTKKDPYSLFAASNFGSFLGLAAYPLIVEPHLTLTEQADWWRVGFAAFVGLTLIAVGLVWRFVGDPQPIVGRVSDPAPALATAAAAKNWTMTRWVLLAMAPSSLMLSVTNHLTTDLASAPFLWAIPLALYLLSFVVAFSRRPIVPHGIVVRYLPIAIFFLVFLWLSDATSPLPLIMLFDLFGFAWLALFCHGELAATRPPADGLTSFYFWVALGGVCGGAFNVLVAPLVFAAYLEYPLMLVLVGALRPFDGSEPVKVGAAKGAGTTPLVITLQQRFLVPLLIGSACLAFVALGLFLNIPAGPTFLIAVILPLLATVFVPRADSYAAALALIMATSLLWPSVHGHILERRRNFFGVHRVAQTYDSVAHVDLVTLVHGNTVHGIQLFDKPREPLAYYHRASPIAAVIDGLNKKGTLKNVGVVGLGSGALAAYGQKDQSWTFFEIDADVENLAKTRFSYLTYCRANVRIVLGDARLTLRHAEEKFDLLVIDAFGSDSIPTHLLTREAMDIYAARLNPDGVLAFHVSNRYLDLVPVLAGLTGHGWRGWASEHGAWPLGDAEKHPGRMTSWWGVLARDTAAVSDLFPSGRWAPLERSESFQPWSDDFINLPAAVRWGELFRAE
jgi:hypothetical protein